MEGSVRPQRGLEAIRPYVPGTPIEEVERRFGLRDVIKLASNENPLGVSPKAVAAMQEALAEVNRYPDGQSHALRSALSDALGVPIDWLLAGNGADGLIVQVSLGYLEDGDEVVVSRSSFAVYDIYAAVMQARLVKTPLTGDYGIDLEAMATAIGPRTKLVYVCNPNNPTGTVVTAAEVDAFLARVPEDVLVVFDEAYVEFVEIPDYPDSIAFLREGRRNVLVLRTLSKSCGIAGIRVGYAIGLPEVLEPLWRVKEPFAVNRVAEAAGIAALADDAFLARTISVNREERECLYAGFDRLGLRYVRSHTNFVLVQLGPRAAEIHQRLLERGVIVRPCVQYELPEHLRITVGRPEETARLLATLEEALAEG